MEKSMKTFMAFALVAASTPLIAAVSEEGPVAKDPGRMICRHVNVRTSETRMGGRRVCHTAAEWQNLQENGAPTADQSTMFHDLRPVTIDTKGLGRSNRPN
jgi:hypothetical protein